MAVDGPEASNNLPFRQHAVKVVLLDNRRVQDGLGDGCSDWSVHLGFCSAL